MGPSTEPGRGAVRAERIFCDANVLWPITLVDLTFRLAQIGYHEIVWTEDLLDELTHVLIDYKGLPPSNAERFCQQIRETFPAGEIPRAMYGGRIGGQVGPDPDDHVHSAAAAEGGATVLLTDNLADFPLADVHPCVPRRPDDYYCEIFDEDPELIEQILEEMSAHLTRPPVSVDGLIDSLERAGCPRLAAGIRAWRAAR